MKRANSEYKVYIIIENEEMNNEHKYPMFVSLVKDYYIIGENDTIYILKSKWWIF